MLKVVVRDYHISGRIFRFCDILNLSFDGHKVVVRDCYIILRFAGFCSILTRSCPSGESLRKSALSVFPLRWSGIMTSSSGSEGFVISLTVLLIAWLMAVCPLNPIAVAMADWVLNGIFIVHFPTVERAFSALWSRCGSVDGEYDSVFTFLVCWFPPVAAMNPSPPQLWVSRRGSGGCPPS